MSVLALTRRVRLTRGASSAWLQPLAVVGIALAGAWLAVAVLAPWLSPYDPLDQAAGLYQPPSPEHLFGTDELGRDVFSRVLWGARVSIPLAVLLVSLAFLIGGTLGALAGYFGGWVDEIVMRGADLVFAIPTILLAMAVVAALGPGLLHAVLAVVVVSWPGHARVVRSMVRTTMESDYVAVARLLGRLGGQGAGGRSPAERGGPGHRPGRAGDGQRDPAAVGAVVPGPGRPSARRLNGARWSRPAPSTSRAGGLAPSRAWPSSRSSWRSTFSATVCVTPSIRRPSRARARRMTALLEVSDLRISLPGPNGFVPIVDGVDFEVQPGQVFGLAGESGCGKTITALSLLRLLPPRARTSGRAMFEGRDLLTLPPTELRACADASWPWSSRTRHRRCTRCSPSNDS